MAEVAEKSALFILSGVTVAIIGHVVKLLISRGRYKGMQDARNLEREHGRAEQETQLRDDLMKLVGGLQVKEAEHQKLIDLLREQDREKDAEHQKQTDLLREQLWKAEDKLGVQTRAKHDILSEINHLSMTIQLYRIGPGGQIDGDNVDLNRLADLAKTGDEK